MISDEDALLLDQLLDISHCSEDELSIAGSSLLDSESLLEELDLHSPAPVLHNHSTLSERSKVKQDVGAGVTGQPAAVADDARERTGGEQGSGQQGSGQLGSGQQGSGQQGSGQLGSAQKGSGQLGSGQQFGTQKSKIIKLNQTSKFRYVPVELPVVDLPPHARKYPYRKRPSPKHTAHTEPDLLLNPRKDRRLSDGDLRQHIVANTQMRTKRRITFDSPVKSESTALEAKNICVNSNSPPYTNHSTTASSETLGLDFCSGKGNSIFVSRPGLVSHSSGGFSLQHLGQRSHFTFSLDHLRSE